jgi:bifunctional NMN adenylyltransferase/nudix hydrolase
MINAAVFIGRFQPFHHGHLYVLRNALRDFSQVVVVLGNHNSLRTVKNPWLAIEREAMIRGAFRGGDERRISFHWQENRKGNDTQWANEVVDGVKQRIWSFDEEVKLTLTGYHKDESSFYLDLFPQWAFSPVTPQSLINATDIRKAYFTGESPKIWGEYLPFSSFNMLSAFKTTNLYKELSSLPRAI